MSAPERGFEPRGERVARGFKPQPVNVGISVSNLSRDWYGVCVGGNGPPHRA